MAVLDQLRGVDREAQEISMLALHLLQSALVLVNNPSGRPGPRRCRLRRPAHRARPARADPAFWSNMAPHGTFELELDTRIDYERGGG